MKIIIKSPCTEDWNKMAPVQQGKFCDSCKKNVVDFSSMTDLEIYHSLQEHQGKLCARISKKQIENFNRSNQELPSPSLIKKWSIAAAIAGVISSPSFSHNTTLNNTPTTIVNTINPFDLSEKTTPTSPLPVEDSIMLSGSVLNGDGLALVGSRVALAGTNLATLVDEKGNFKLKIPKTSKKVALIASYSEEYYSKTIELKADKNQKDILFKLKYDPHFEMLMGDVYIPED